MTQIKMVRIPILFCWVLMMFSLGLSGTPALSTKIVQYGSMSAQLEGFIAQPLKGNKKVPAVLIVHDWMGEGAFSQEKANLMANWGYVGFAVDVYGKGNRPKSLEEAGQFASLWKSDRKSLRKRLQVSLDYIKTIPGIDTTQIAVIGFCFGGGAALELTRSGVTLAGTVSFHGNLDSPLPAQKGEIKSKILVLHGASDPYVPISQVDDFRKEMDGAGVDWEMISYGNAVHAFTNPKAGTDVTKGAAFNALADQRAFERLKGFLNEIFRK